MLFGVFKKWPFLINPPEKMSGFYSQSFIKKVFGQKVLIFETIFIGLAFIGFGLYGLLNGINNW